ncbi:hypothetical protein [Streptomyces sp. NPDC017524]
MLYGAGGFAPNEPGQGNPATYPWRAALDAVADVLDPTSIT